MHALIVVDAQNEFAAGGHRTVPNHAHAFAVIRARVAAARAAGQPVAWVQHFNLPHEGPAFQPGTRGVELGEGLEVETSRGEKLFQKSVYGGFTGTGLEEWLRSRDVTSVTLVGFFAHMCLSTTAREALVRGFDVEIDAEATGSVDLKHPILGALTADEVRRSALLQLAHMGARITSGATRAPAPAHAPA